jgi:hypothetical protein
MNESPKSHDLFSVTSGALCFGSLQNILVGAATPVQSFPNVQPEPSGTVRIHRLEFNVPAQNGTWLVFQLINIMSKSVTGYFVCHADVTPREEVQKILRVSGSPYEEDHGSLVNNDETRANGVFVINRYDWGHYDRRSVGDVSDGDQVAESDFTRFEAAGLVDYACADLQVSEWRRQRPSKGSASENGTWMYIPDGEYMFGRFGFDDERVAARSFLFFTASTYFTRTAFDGLESTLRQEESHEERFQRRLREEYDFSGIAQLQQLGMPVDEPGIVNHSPRKPPEADLLGPFPLSESIFRPIDIETLRSAHGKIVAYTRDVLESRGVDPRDFLPQERMKDFADPWRSAIYDLLNELMLSYLTRFILPQLALHGVEVVGQKLFFGYQYGDQSDGWLYSGSPLQESLPEALDSTSIRSRVCTFLGAQISELALDGDEILAEGISRVLAYLIFDILEMANNCATDNHRSAIVPYDIRLAVYNDRQMPSILQYSAVLWNGRT